MDNVPGTSGNDTITGTVDTATATSNTFSVADIINGAGGNGDMLQVQVSAITGATSFTPTQVSNVEILRVINNDATPDVVSFDLTAT